MYKHARLSHPLCIYTVVSCMYTPSSHLCYLRIVLASRATAAVAAVACPPQAVRCRSGGAYETPTPTHHTPTRVLSSFFYCSLSPVFLLLSSYNLRFFGLLAYFWISALSSGGTVCLRPGAIALGEMCPFFFGCALFTERIPFLVLLFGVLYFFLKGGVAEQERRRR